MPIGNAIYSLLTSDGTLSSAIGTKVFPDTVPQGQLFPAVVYTVVGTDPTDAKDGASPLDVLRIQIDTYSTSYDSTQTIKDRIRTVLDRYSGTVQMMNIDSIRFSGDGSGDYEENIGIYWVSQNFDIRLRR